MSFLNGNGFFSPSVPAVSKSYSHMASPICCSPQSVEFYLSNSSGDGTCDKLYTEMELNSKLNFYSGSHYSGEQIEEYAGAEESLDFFLNEPINHIINLLSQGTSQEIANASAYICHLSYQNPEGKGKIAECNGINILSKLLLSSTQVIRKNCVHALRNLCFEPTLEIRKKIDDASVISNLFIFFNEIIKQDVSSNSSMNTLKILIVESITAIICNLALYSEFKDSISRNWVQCLTRYIILPYSGAAEMSDTHIRTEDYESPAFIHATGTIRNVLGEDADCRHRLRETTGLVAALICVCSQFAENYDFDGKALENCVCILRNLSFALQEIRDPAYLVRREVAYAVAATTPVSEKKLVFKHLHLHVKGRRRGIVMNLKSSSTANIWMGGGPDYLDKPPSNLESIQGSRRLWAQDLLEIYVSILRYSTNHVILEAVAGAIQNLTACDWEPSNEVRSFFSNGDNVLVLAAPLISEDDNVVLTTATALRNVAENKDLRGVVAFYTMRLLITRLPVLQAASATDGETIIPTHNCISLRTASAILAALYVLVKGDTERASLFLDCGGVPPLLAIAHTGLYTDPTDPVPSNRNKTVRFARFILQTLWAERDLRERFKKAGWHAIHFCVREPIVRDALKQSFLASIWPSTDVKMHVDHVEDRVAPESQCDLEKMQGSDNERLIDGPADDDAHQNLLPVRTGSHRPRSLSGRPPLSQRPSNSHLLQPVAPAADSPHLLSPYFREPTLLPNSRSFPLLQIPDHAPSHPGSRSISRHLSLQIVNPEEPASFTPHSQTPLLQNGSISLSKKGYFSQLNIPEVVARHPSRRKEPRIERSISPFLHPSASNLDLKSLALNTPVKSQNYLCLPGQHDYLETSPRRASSNSRHDLQHLQPFVEAKHRLSQSSCLSNNLSKNSSLMLEVIPPSPVLRPPSVPATKARANIPPTPRCRTKLSDSVLARQGRLSRLTSSQTYSRSQSYRLTAPPRVSPNCS